MPAETPYPGSPGLADLERRVGVLESDNRDALSIRETVAVLDERSKTQGREINEMRRSLTWLVRSVLGATGLLAILAGYILQSGGGG